jgi:hypothetical protein
MIRRATPADGSSICRVHIASIRGISGGHYSDAQIDGWCAGRRPECYLWPIAEQFTVVAEVFGEVAGFAQQQAIATFLLMPKNVPMLSLANSQPLIEARQAKLLMLCLIGFLGASLATRVTLYVDMRTV